MHNLQFVQEFESHSNYLRHFAMKLTRDKSRADDLFQETALKALSNQRKYIANTNIRAWLTTIMKNLFINLYRKQKRRNELHDGTSNHFFLNETSEVINNEGEMNMNVKEVHKIIDELDESYRVPFMMVYQGYKYDEIQEAMGNLPMGTIKSRIYHARRILQHRVHEVYGDAVA